MTREAICNPKYKFLKHCLSGHFYPLECRAARKGKNKRKETIMSTKKKKPAKKAPAKKKKAPAKKKVTPSKKKKPATKAPAKKKATQKQSPAKKAKKANKKTTVFNVDFLNEVVDSAS